MSRKILVVDDNQINRALLNKMLRAEYEVLEAENGEKALEILREVSVEISTVILDIRMPKLDGYGVLEIMRADEALSQIPVIVTTGSAKEDTEIKALKMGANDFITKPYKRDVILQRLSNTISLREKAALVNATKIDALTGILSRTAFFDKARELIHLQPSGYYVMACFDVENFKVINDQYGNTKGDDVLKQIAKLLDNFFSLRESICCRIMADNYAVLYPVELSNKEELGQLREQISLLDGSIFPITYSIGRYLVDDLALAPEAMYDRAVLAKASVKGLFNQHIAIYDESMRNQLLEQQEITREMKDALLQGQFEVWFQPQINHSAKSLIGAEALVRWNHPTKGMISPTVFIPIFEKNGFVYEVDKYVWRQACRTIKTWKEEGRETVPISVNISRYDMLKDDIVEVIEGLVREYGVKTSDLRLEVTETAFSQSPDTIILAIQKLKELGFTVEIDDFGSGFSSLNTLKDVPADIIKLDMRFLEGKVNATRGGNILESVVRMAKWLGMSVIAEGVETKKQADFLESIGCSYLQGFYYARPMSLEKYEEYIRQWNKEKDMSAMETIVTLDNDSFWNPESAETLIFNSYVGGACILECYHGKMEILRINERYVNMLGGEGMNVEEALKIYWMDYVDDAGKKKLSEMITEAIQSRNEVSDELCFIGIRKECKEVYLQISMRVIATAGERYLIYSVLLDVTKLRDAEIKLRENDRKLKILNRNMKNLMNDTPGGFRRMQVISREEIHVVYTNKGFCDLLGYTENEIKRMSAMELVHPEDKESVLDSIISAVSNPHRSTLRFRLRYRSGEYGWFFAFGRVTLEEDGKVYLNVYYNDISDQYKLDVQRNELIENLPCGAAIYSYKNERLGVVYVNERLKSLVGGRIKHMENDITSLDSVYHADRVMLYEALQDAITHHKRISCDVRILHADGDYIPFHLVGNFVSKDGDDYIYTTYLPISEGELSFREMLPIALEAMMSSNRDMSFVKDKNLNYICCSHTFAEMVGLNHEKEIVGKNDFDLFDFGLAKLYRDVDRKLLCDEESVDSVEQIPSKDGLAHYSNTSKHVLRDSVGNVIGIYGSGRDITEEKEAFERLRLLTDSIPGGLVMLEVTDSKTRALYVSDGVSGILGYTVEEYNLVTAEDAFYLIITEDREVLQQHIYKLIKENVPLDCMCRIISKSQEYVWINIRGSLVETGEKSSIVNTVFFDVTKQKKADMKLNANRKAMEVAGQNGGIAFWIYNVDEKLIRNDVFQNLAGNHEDNIIKDVPESLICRGDVYSEDIENYRQMYHLLEEGKDRSECTVRLRNINNKRYEWQHIIYTKMVGSNIEGNSYIGFSSNADLEQENRQRYEREFKLRRELIRNSVFYFQLNLSTRQIEEYHSQNHYTKETNPTLIINEDIENQIISKVYEKDVDQVKDTLFPNALLEAYERGEFSTKLLFKEWLPNLGLRWVKAESSIMEKPDSGEVIAFIHGRDVDRETKDQIAVETIMDEEIEFVGMVKVQDGMAHLIQMKDKNSGLSLNKEFNFDKHFERIISSAVLEEDREECSNFFHVNRLSLQLQEANVVKLTYRVKNADGEVHRKKIRAFYLDEMKEEIVVIRRDITDLYDEEQRQKRKLQKAIMAANAANNAKSEFLSNMSHDIRTPLNAVLAFSTLEMTEEATEPELREYLGKIHQSGEYLLGIINDVLDMSKIEQHKVVLHEEPYCISDFVETIQNIFERDCESRDIDFHLDFAKADYPDIYVDKTRFDQIFINLLSNAVKFTLAGGKVELLMQKKHKIDDENCMIRFIVRDTGIGMSPEFIPHAFESFKQEYHKGLRENVQGTGLGLSIVKELVGLMNGTIEVKSELNKGTEFTIDMPIKWAKTSTHTEQVNMNENASLLGLHVLLAEDNEVNAEIAIALLEKHGCSIDRAEDGKQALNLFLDSGDRGYDIVLMDLRMPVMDGLEASKAIRMSKRKDAKKVPIIAMTADVFDEDEKKAREAGMNGHLPKPIIPAELYKTLRRYAYDKNS